jgi:4-amino-4-deoxy-L-arabinose transferase-like glycosyltransferase
MTIASETTNRSLQPTLALAVAILAGLTIVRLIGLKLSTVDLFFDEAQYWAWSREPAFGYFSKPPLLAWIISLAEHICGSSEACIRAPAPVFWFGTSLLVYAVARLLYDAKIAFYAALSLALALGVVFSARIISTDVPLLFFWALALLAYVKLYLGGDMRWGLILGLALGLGLLAKYAMVYFVLGIALACFIDARAREILRGPSLWLGLAIAALLISPNIIWNMQNDLATFRHTGDNIQGGGLAFSPLKGLEFVASQFGVFGPVVFSVLLYALFRIAAPDMSARDRLMLAFAIPPLVLVTGTAFVTRALANWAAPAFISAVVLATAILIRRDAWQWLRLSLGLGIAAQVLLLVTDRNATNLHVPYIANGDVYRRTLGWRALGEQAGAIAQRVGAKAIVGAERDDEASLLYYWRDKPEQVLAWPTGPVANHHFDITRALTNDTPLPILFVSRCGDGTRLASQFGHVDLAGVFGAPTGPTSRRTYYAFRLDGLLGPIRPLPNCRALAQDQHVVPEHDRFAAHLTSGEQRGPRYVVSIQDWLAEHIQVADSYQP